MKLVRPVLTLTGELVPLIPCVVEELPPLPESEGNELELGPPVPTLTEERAPLPESEEYEIELVPLVPCVVEELLPLPESEGNELDLVRPVSTMVEELLRILGEDKVVDDPPLAAVLVDEIVPPGGVVKSEAEVEVETCCEESVSLSVIE